MSAQRGVKPVDTPAMVQYCLSCPFPDCWDCLGKNNAYTYGLRMELDERFRNRQARRVLRKVAQAKEAKEKP